MLKSFKQLGIQFLFLLALYSVIRIFFMIYNWGSYQLFDSAELISSLFLGLRFDISSILMMNIPFFLYWLYPSARERKLSLNLFFVINVLFLAINIADFELTRFNGRRLTPFYFVLSQDVGDQLGQLILHFWHLALGLIVAGTLLVKFFPKPIRVSEKSALITVIASYLLFLPVWLVGVRGGLQSRPVREANAFIFSSPKLGNLALNTSFTFIYARKSSKAERYNFFTDLELEEFKRQFKPKASELHGKLQGSNVLVIVMESFALEYMGKVNNREGFTPFLDGFAENALFFKNAYANGRRSIDSIPSILAGIPSLLKEPFLLSGRQNAKILGYPRIIKELAYSTHFFHAAKNGSMFFDVFAKRIGKEVYSGLSEYPSELRERDYDGYWGIWDDPYFQFTRKEINKVAKPFFMTLFSLSAHQPYDLPKGMEDTFPKGTLDIHPTVAYSDYSLGKFFKSIEKEDWYTNTLFVITADHTSQTDDPAYANQQGEYRVPIIFYHPTFDKWPDAVDQKVIQHVDILPTVLDLIGVEQDQQVTGRSAFSDSNGFVVNRVPGGFWYADAKGFMKMNLSGELTETDGDIVRENLFRAYVQYVVNGVNDNKLVKPKSASE